MTAIQLVREPSLTITSMGGTHGLQGRMCTVSNSYPVLSKLTLTRGFPMTKAFSFVHPSDSRITGVYEQTLFRPTGGVLIWQATEALK